jgi:hypothetical protein
MTELEQQVDQGQGALGRLIRQFFLVNDFKHVQFMQMAHALTGERWLHSSQISTLKRGGAKNLTGFPLYSVAAVNRRLWEIERGTAKHPPGTRPDDWEGRKPIMNPATSLPVDIGDLWRIYFGEMEPPYFTEKPVVELDDRLAENISKQIADIVTDCAIKKGTSLVAYIDQTLLQCDDINATEARLLKGVCLGVIDLNAEQVTECVDGIAELLSVVKGEKFSESRVYELGLLLG